MAQNTDENSDIFTKIYELVFLIRGHAVLKCDIAKNTAFLDRKFPAAIVLKIYGSVLTFWRDSFIHFGKPDEFNKQKEFLPLKAQPLN